MEVQLLGPIAMSGPSGVVDLRGSKQRALLAVLALHRGQTQSEERLVEALWGRDAPRTANRTLHSYVSRLRQSLANAGSSVTIETRPAGYLLLAEPHVIDVTRAEELVAEGRRAMSAGDPSRAATSFADAVRLWRGQPLGEFAHEPWALTEATRLSELRLDVLEERIEADLACGRHAVLASELDALCSANPLRERLWGQRMICLYRAGRQAEALAVYQALRTRLAEELGIDPGPQVQELHRAVLAQDASLDWTPQPGVVGGTPYRDLPTGIVTFLMTDIEQSTALWDARPEVMPHVLMRHDELVSRAVEGVGGTVIKSRGEGDATLSAFRRASEALAAALMLRISLAEEEWPDDITMAVRLALHTGEAHERDGDYYGPTLNRASRLRSLAAGGELLLSEATATLVRDHLPRGVVLVDWGPQALRGLAREERVFAVDLTPRHSLLETAAREPSNPPFPAALRAQVGDGFVGRGHEQEMLGNCWTDVTKGNRRTVLVAGEPGIGKTRLSAEFALGVHADGATVLYGRCDEDLGVAYQPFSEALGTYVASAPLAVLREHVEHCGGELSLLVPDLSRRVPAARPGGHADPEGERLRLFESVVSLIAAASEKTPVTLVLDDLQWATKPTLLLLRHLLRTATPMSLLVIATYRDTELDRTHPLAEMLADLRREAGVERIPLDGLAEPAVLDFIRTATPHVMTNSSLVRTLHEQTDGNPFFLGEVLRHLDDTGALKSGTASSQSLPEGIRDVVSRRLSRLSAECNTMLGLASVVGPDVPVQVLEFLLEDDLPAGRLFDVLDEAHHAQILVEALDRPGHYVFAHALIRQTLYAELSTARRVRLHRRVGEALEQLEADALPLDSLAYHFAESAMDGQLDKAVRYGLESARAARSQYAFEKSIADADRALGVLELDSDPDENLRYELWLLIATLRGQLFDHHGAAEAAIAAGVCARRLGSPELLAGAALAGLGILHGGLIPGDKVIALAEEALVALGHESSALRAQVLAALSGYRSIRHVSDSEPAAREALAIARATDEPSSLLLALDAMAWVLFNSERVAETQALADELLALAREHEDELHEANGYYWRGPTRLAVGDLAGFDETLAGLDRIAQRTHSVLNTARVSMWKTMRALLDGRFDDVEALAAQMVGDAGDDPAFVQAYGGQLFILRREQGRLRELQPMLMALAAEQQTLPVFTAIVAQVHCELGEADAARPLFETLAENDFAALREDLARVAALQPLAEVAVALGDAERAATIAAMFAGYRGVAITAAGALCLGAADRYLGMLAMVRGRFDEAEEHLAAALDLETRIGSAPLTARTQYWYAHFLLRRGEGDDAARARELLDACISTAQRLGMAALVEQATSTLSP